MSKAIKIENLYKEYKLGVIGRGTLYRDLQSWWALSQGKEDPNSLIGHSENKNLIGKNLLALNNINLDVEEGEILGIIGSNGAGKSTLLKILSKVTMPTKGRIKFKGKASSLLEVGTGFHPELTGRENIYLNAAINGMNRNEVTKKIDEIVDFAGVSQFLDTPVKRYSSGMHVRLGFAVAAYLEPDILVVDEVLAVGDADFQKKAINKMQDVSKKKGRTVLFVSHNMESIRKLCNRVIVMSQGKIAEDGNTENSIKKYIGSVSSTSRNYKHVKWKDLETAPGGDIVRLKSLSIKDINGNYKDKFNLDEKIFIETEFYVKKEGYQICNSIGFTYFSSKTMIESGQFFLLDDYVKNEWGKQENFKVGNYISTLELPPNLLNEGIYNLIVDIFLPPATPDSSFQVRKHNVISFEIIDDYKNIGARGSYPNDWQAGNGAGYLIRPVTKFETVYQGKE